MSLHDKLFKLFNNMDVQTKTKLMGK